MTDTDLLARYLANRSDEAFGEIVDRYLPLVYSAAVRQLGDGHLAEDAAQAVFLVLIKKAGSLGARTVLPAWLLTTTRYVCRDARKLAARREIHERKAAVMHASVHAGGEVGESAEEAAAIGHHLDDALAALSEGDRAAVALRYFEARPLRDVAAVLQISEPATQKRVERALGKLRAFFAGRNVTLSAAGLPVALAAHAPVASVVPAALAGTIAAAHTSAAMSGTAMALAHSALRALFWTPAKIAASIILIAATATGVTATVARTHTAAPASPATNIAASSTAPAIDGIPIAAIDIDGNHHISTGALAPVIKSHPGTPYSKALADADAKAIFALGSFTDVRLNAILATDPDTGQKFVCIQFIVVERPAAPQPAEPGFTPFVDIPVRQKGQDQLTFIDLDHDLAYPPPFAVSNPPTRDDFVRTPALRTWLNEKNISLIVSVKKDQGQVDMIPIDAIADIMVNLKPAVFDAVKARDVATAMNPIGLPAPVESWTGSTSAGSLPGAPIYFKSRNGNVGILECVGPDHEARYFLKPNPFDPNARMPDTISLCFKRVLPEFHLVNKGEGEIAFSTARGAAFINNDVHLVDDGTHLYAFRTGSSQVGRSASFGLGSALAADLLHRFDIRAQPANADKFERNVAADKVVDGALAKAYLVPAQEKGDEPAFWTDETGRIVAMNPPWAREQETMHATYDKPPAPELFAIPSGPDVRVIDTDAWFEQRFPLKTAIAKKEAHGQIVALHTVEQGLDGVVLVSISSRFSDATLKELGVKEPKLGLFLNVPSFYTASVDAERDLPYAAALLATARSQTWVVAWYALMPKRPLQGALALPVSLIATHSNVTDWLKSRGEPQTSMLEFSAKAAVPEKLRSYLDLADSLYSDAEAFNPVLSSFEVTDITTKPDSATVFGEPPSEKYSRADYLKSLQEYVATLRK